MISGISLYNGEFQSCQKNLEEFLKTVISDVRSEEVIY